MELPFRIPAMNGLSNQRIIKMNSKNPLYPFAFASILLHASVAVIFWGDKKPYPGNLAISIEISRPARKGTDGLNQNGKQEKHFQTKADVGKTDSGKIPGRDRMDNSALAELNRNIGNSIAYPPAALEMGWEDVVKIDVPILPPGNAGNPVFIRKSRYEVFNAAVVDAVKAWRYPVRKEKINIVLTFKFTINEKEKI